jgi:predicted secreted hydrolase
MKSKAVLASLLAVLPLLAQQWRLALPGYRFQFPRDHFSHPAYQIEWWYYTGNLRAPNGRRFGFELTFFRHGEHLRAAHPTVWTPNEIYLAHFAVTDIARNRFYFAERLNRAGPGLAGVDLSRALYWNGNWQVRWLSANLQQLRAVCDRSSIALNLKLEKPVMINGEDGLSRKGPAPGDASHYISCPLLAASGAINLDGTGFAVSGTAWMDHEFFSAVSTPEAAGWDWFAIQLNNNQELMLYRLRSHSGDETPFSAGTLVDSAGRAQHLKASQFTLSPLAWWSSPHSGARYPVSWKISVPSAGIELTENPDIDDQELFDKNAVTPTYWEGAVTYSGTAGSRAVHGVGYLEMTGYAGDYHPQ